MNERRRPISVPGKRSTDVVTRSAMKVSAWNDQPLQPSGKSHSTASVGARRCRRSGMVGDAIELAQLRGLTIINTSVQGGPLQRKKDCRSVTVERSARLPNMFCAVSRHQ
jgi:hypothetical protein